ncbi:ArsR family transcriptional regulator [Galbitalea soli]|uniref:ArsR family transcriptional regulator n=1 Tax=Galbitalea soli TaxID=1268042 RepID=A0A7C9PPU0_9MICO|nr:ArsR family transcriptional regulator [Galbitalea soli]NEM92368.1 ArsR family transcriptional regulator [Galbitalea soli]NYJ31675.1 putative nucleotidyltransferase [Galbitalea soli]
MKKTVSALSPLLRSTTQGDLLGALIVDPARKWTIRELSQHIGSSYAGVHAEIERLALGQVVREERVGKARVVWANEGYELYRPLAEIVLHAYGPRALLTEALEGVPGVERAFIYGSWAARYAGEFGAPPQDIDVLVVGDASRATLEDIADTVSRRVGREVTMTRVTAEKWDAGDDLFLTTIRERPHVELLIGGTDAHALGERPRRD